MKHLLFAINNSEKRYTVTRLELMKNYISVVILTFKVGCYIPSDSIHIRQILFEFYFDPFL